MAGGGGEEDPGSIPWLSAWGILSFSVSGADHAVPRKARGSRPRGGAASRWWGVKIPAPTPRLPQNPPRAKRKRRARIPDLNSAAPGLKGPAIWARQCLECGVTETPQWRSGPMGSCTLCNACGIRAADALRTTASAQARARARAAAVVSEQPPLHESRPVSEPVSVPGSSICSPGEDDSGGYLPKQRVSQPPTTESAPAPPPPAPAAATREKRKSNKKKMDKKKKHEAKPYLLPRDRETGKRCVHCASSSTPKWRRGPQGRNELCNACGVRYKQGALLPEYRPLASPTFKPSDHSYKKWEVFYLNRKHKKKNRRCEAPPPPQPMGGGSPDPMDDDEVLEPIPLEIRPPSPVNNVALAIIEYCPHPPPPPEQLQPANGGDDNGELMHKFQPAPLHQQLLPCPVDETVGCIEDLANACAVDGDDPMGELNSPSLLDGPAAPMLVDGEDAFFN